METEYLSPPLNIEAMKTDEEEPLDTAGDDPTDPSGDPIEPITQVKEEDLEVFEDTSQSIIYATQAVEQATESVNKIKKYVSSLISVDEVADNLLVAVRCCKEASEAFQEAAKVWQEIQRQNISSADLKEEKEICDQVKTEAGDQYDNYQEDYQDYSDDDMAYEGVDEEEGEKLKLKGEVSDDESTGFIITEDESGEKVYSCDFDGCGFSRKESLKVKRHRRNVHLNYTPKWKRRNKTDGVRKKYPCQLCESQFSAEENLRKHTLKIHNEPTVKCKHCKLFFIGDGREKLYAHMSERHPDEAFVKKDPVPPGHYFKYFKEENGEQECLYCTFKCKRGDSKENPYNAIRRHVKTHLVQKKLFKCDECDYSIELAENQHRTYLKQHIESVHRGVRYPCPWEGCNHQAKQKRNLKKHIEGVHEKKPLNCKKCPFSHRDQQALRRHVREMHMDEKWYCDECTFIGPNMTSINIHKIKAHGANAQLQVREYDATMFKDEEGKRVRMFKCDHCPFISRFQSSQINHMKNKHQEHSLMCDQCEFTTYEKFLLKRHIEMEHQAVMYKCEFCEFTTKRKEALKKHKRKHEGNTFSCEYDGCSFQASFKCDLSIHVDAVHKKIRHYCPECEFSSARRGDLNRHVRKSHNPDTQNMLKCFRCLFTTSLKSFLIEHIMEQHEQDDLVKLEAMTAADVIKLTDQ